VVLAGKGHELVQLTNFGKKEWNDKKVLMEILQSQGKRILNASEIKKQYLEEMKDKKNPEHITPEQYLSSEQPIEQPTQHQPSGMFQPV
jgi:hypothetical protein